MEDEPHFLPRFETGPERQKLGFTFHSPDPATTPLATPPVSARRSEELRQMEDELRDPKNFLEYFLPRPIRVIFFRFSAASASLATLLTFTRVVQVRRHKGKGVAMWQWRPMCRMGNGGERKA